MNIGMTHYAFYPTTGGVESHLLDLCAEMVKQGHEVHAIVGSRPGSPAEETMEGIHIHRSDLMNPELVRQRKTAAGLLAEEDWPALRREIREFYREYVDRY